MLASRDDDDDAAADYHDGQSSGGVWARKGLSERPKHLCLGFSRGSLTSCGDANVVPLAGTIKPP
eukprot:5223027-Amphidinium_carterae.1